MIYEKEVFENPPSRYRIRPMTHVWPGHDREIFVQMLKDYGYGGVVTNVRQEDGFTANRKNLEEFNGLVELLKKNEMSYWLYDESGYPSGSGGGLVLKGHEELEAKGLYMHRIVSYEKRTAHFRLDMESDKIVWAAKYRLDTERPEDSIFLENSCLPVAFERETLTCEMDAGEVLYIFCRKSAYEGSHCTHNICSYHRYINILDPAAVKRFLELCYEPVAAVCPDAYSWAEAVFTDEPSLQSFYVREYEAWPYALIPWTDDLPEMYQEEYGSPLYPGLPYLFEGTQSAGPVRVRFYNLIGKRIARAYTGQIREWCEAHGGRFSGHYLGEEMMADHVRAYGSLLEVLLASSYPGIDILACYPEGYYYNTAKYAQMAVRKNRTNGMMAEVCPFDHPEIFEQAPVDNFLATVALNFLSGVRVTHSYFEADYSGYDGGRFRDYKPRDEQKFGKYRGYMDETTARRVNEYVGRLGYVLDNLENRTDLFIYYGLEDVQAKTKPSHTAAVGDAIQADMRTIPVMRRIYEAGYDFYYIDKEDLTEAARFQNAGKKTEISGNPVSAIVIPALDVMYEESMEALCCLQEKGVRIFFLDQIPQRGCRGNELPGREKFVPETLESVMTHLDRREKTFQIDVEGTVPLQAAFCKEGKELHFLVNRSREDLPVKFSHREKTEGLLLNPEDGTITLVRAGERERIKALRSVFLLFD